MNRDVLNRRMVRWPWLALLASALLMAPVYARAAPRRPRAVTRSAARQVVVVAPQGFIVTQFAVPVAVPVAPRSYIAYPPLPPVENSSGMTSGAVDESATEITGAALIRQKCGGCHAAENPQGNFSLGHPARMTDAGRVLAIRRLLDDDPQRRMPKGSQPTPDELGRLIQALVE